MPQFELNDNAQITSMDDFVSGYIEAMFFTNGDIGDEVRPDYLNELGTGRLTKESRANIEMQCARFLVSPCLGVAVSDVLARFGDYDDEQAGRDLWFTRQGHGAGYWDRDEIEPVRDALSDCASGMGEAYVEVYRGWIHHA